MVNPSNLVAFDDVRRYIKGANIEPQICTEDDFRRFMDSVYPQLMGLDKGERSELEKKTSEERRERKDDRRKQSLMDQSLQSLEDLQNEILGNMEVQTDEEEKISAGNTSASEDAPWFALRTTCWHRDQEGASDIHIEPQEDGVFVRLRVERILKVERALQKIQLPLFHDSRFSRLDISERRMPQDGRISIKIDDRSIEFRVSTDSGEIR
jgi:type IV pilus assembly protein PilB